MIDARISVGLPAHPKTKKLIRRLGEDGAWRLVCLFLWVAQSRPDGDLSGMTGEDIELAADWQGEEGAFIKALIEVGFVDGEEGAYSVHDWEEHNPWAAGSNRRSEVARQNALKKWSGSSSSENAKTRSQRLAEARAKGKHTKEEWEALKAVCGDACVKCGAADLDLSKDHIIPICKGGSDGIENIQPMCHRCNSGKGGSDSADLRPEGWSELLSERLQNACKTPANFDRTHAPSPSPLPYPNSEAKASASSPAKAMEPDEIIFGYGVPLLTNAGTPEKQARSFLGGLRKQHGDQALIDKLRDCIKAKPLQPLEWLGAALPPRSRTTPTSRMPAAENFASKDYGRGGLIC